jgi:hypothetical protein
MDDSMRMMFMNMDQCGVSFDKNSKTGGNVARATLASLIGVLVIACHGCAGRAPQSLQANQVGFINPSGVATELVSKTSFGMINAESVSQISSGLAAVVGSTYKVNVDFTLILTQPKSLSQLGTTYHDLAGNELVKVFSPLAIQKLSMFPSDDQIRQIVGPYLDVLETYASNVGTIFLADEPYINGISKAEMERAGQVIRQELNIRNMPGVKLGVIFASGTFDADFADQIDKESGEYVEGIDNYYRQGEASLANPGFDVAYFNEWLSSIQTARLTTYDAAGNMYTGGGIPNGFDVVGFDFYLSTILLDRIHEGTLSWLASRFSDAGCSQFTGETMTQVKASLSFFQNGPQLQGDQYQNADRDILNSVFQCRMQAMLEMLQRDLGAAASSTQILMISESSSNGVREFYSDGTPKPDQPAALVESRAFDEVNRAERFYTNHRQSYPAGLLFFTYQNATDYSINLDIEGGVGLPSVLSSIFQFSTATQ